MARRNLLKQAVASSRLMCVWVNTADQAILTVGRGRSRHQLEGACWGHCPLMRVSSTGWILKMVMGGTCAMLAGVVCESDGSVSLGLAMVLFLKATSSRWLVV